MSPRFLAIARELVRVAQLVLADHRFALKGGTAINFFLRELPRLSVDLDLVLVDGALARAEALASIDEGLRAARARLQGGGFSVRTAQDIDGALTALRVDRGAAQIKVEVSQVIRGTVLPVLPRPMTPTAQ